MASLRGESENPDVAGVYGEGDGAGVWGKSKTWWGVKGETEKKEHGGGGVLGIGGKVGPGVLGNSESGIGVVGESTWIGVKGETKDNQKGIGVLGVHNAGGSAVIGVSEKQGGIGIHGKGAHRAGFFEGNVEITGNLMVQGISVQSLLQRIQQLEQKVGGGPPPSQRTISVTKEGTGLNTVFTVTGAGFTPNGLVVVRITAPNLEQISFAESAGADGKFVAKRSVPCLTGLQLTVTAFEDADSTKQATPVHTTCP